MLIPAIVLSGASAHSPKLSRPAPASVSACQKLSLTADVQAGQEWSAPIGQGWLLRLVPIAPSGKGYTGWDIAVSPEGDTAYPDALLLGTPPYGSLNEREIGTTFGLRAQDAIAWHARQFHFLLSAAKLVRARELFREITAAASSTTEARKKLATGELLQLVEAGPSNAFVGTGKLRILDASYVAGTADPAPYAQQWASNLSQVPHTVVDTRHAATPRGEMVSMRMNTTLWFPGAWKFPSKLPAGAALEPATCPE